MKYCEIWDLTLKDKGFPKYFCPKIPKYFIIMLQHCPSHNVISSTFFLLQIFDHEARKCFLFLSEHCIEEKRIEVDSCFFCICNRCIVCSLECSWEYLSYFYSVNLFCESRTCRQATIYGNHSFYHRKFILKR